MTSSRATSPELDDSTARFMTDDEAVAVFEEACTEWMKLSADEFLARRDAGGFGGDLAYWPAINVAGLLYLVRRSEW